MVTFKRCPFCGEKPKIKSAKYNEYGQYGNSTTQKQWFAVYCPNCKVSQPIRAYYSKECAVSSWNNRV